MHASTHTHTTAKLAHDRQECAVGDRWRIAHKEARAALGKLGLDHAKHLGKVAVIFAHLLAKLYVNLASERRWRDMQSQHGETVSCASQGSGCKAACHRLDTFFWHAFLSSSAQSAGYPYVSGRIPT